MVDVRQGLARAGGALAEGLGRLVLPPHCVGCERPLERWTLLCAACRRGLPLVGDRACPRCGRPVGPNLPVGTDCVECRRLPLRHVTAVAAAGVHEGGLRVLILRLKGRWEQGLPDLLARLIRGQLERQAWLGEVDLVVPVPIHWRRRWWRGYNQAGLLAERLGQQLRRPVAPGALRRPRHCLPQVGLSVAARISNVAGSVRPGRQSGRVAGATVLVVDDVMTTGATLSECGRVLRGAGARRVYGAVAAVRHRARFVPGDDDPDHLSP